MHGNEVAHHEGNRHEAQSHAEQHGEEPRRLLGARPLDDAPRHEEGRNAVREMEDRCEHADEVEDEDDRTARDVALDQFIGDRCAEDTLDIAAQVADVPYEEDEQEPCRPALESEIPVVEVAILRRVVLRLHADVDAIDRMEEERDGDGADLKSEENRLRYQLHHCELAVQGFSTAQSRSIGEDVFHEKSSECQQADQGMQAAGVKSCVNHSIPPINSLRPASCGGGLQEALTSSAPPMKAPNKRFL